MRCVNTLFDSLEMVHIKDKMCLKMVDEYKKRCMNNHCLYHKSLLVHKIVYRYKI